MENEIAIRVKDVHKSFKLFFDKSYSLKETLLFKKRRKYETLEVIKGISFDVKKGEAIGLVGHNGCGKSTMLKMLTKIMYPDSGSIEIKGRVSSLIELGAGFHPDMSGRENIYINAAIFGLSREEIDERLQDIIDFSEIEEFIDNPVRTYSSGMYMRLAFSVAINVDADVLLIDEILAVGDVAFQNKCFNRLREIKAKGTTIVIVSHSLGQIEQICERSFWINDGVICAEGDPKAVHMTYLDYMISQRQGLEETAPDIRQPETEEASAAAQPASEDTEENMEETPSPQEETPAEVSKRWGSQDARITAISIRSSEGRENRLFRTGDNIDIEVTYEVKNPVRNAVFGIGIFNRSGVQCYGTNTGIDKLDSFDLEKSGSMTLHLLKVNLLPGEYLIDLAIEKDQGIPIDYYREAAVIEFASNIGDVGVARIEHSWSLEIQ